MKPDTVTIERAGLLLLLEQAWDAGAEFRDQHGSSTDDDEAKRAFIRKLTGSGHSKESP